MSIFSCEFSIPYFPTLRPGTKFSFISGFSRSTVYKTIKKFEQANLVYIQQSQGDKREFNLILAN